MKSKLSRKIIIGYIIFGSVVILLPGIIGGILAAVNKNLIFLEVMYVVFGLIDLMLITIRLRMRDGQNYKKRKSITEDKEDDDYKIWLKEQYFIAILGIIDLLLSLVVFLISSLI